jgi:hypothetical protein
MQLHGCDRRSGTVPGRRDWLMKGLGGFVVAVPTCGPPFSGSPQ